MPVMRRRRLRSIHPRRCWGRSKFGGFLYSCVSSMAFPPLLLAQAQGSYVAGSPVPSCSPRAHPSGWTSLASVLRSLAIIIFVVLGLDSCCCKGRSESDSDPDDVAAEFSGLQSKYSKAIWRPHSGTLV